MKGFKALCLDDGEITFIFIMFTMLKIPTPTKAPKIKAEYVRNFNLKASLRKLNFAHRGFWQKSFVNEIF